MNLQELDGYLDSIINFGIIAKLLIKYSVASEFNMELMSTILETMYENLQEIVGECCVKGK